MVDGVLLLVDAVEGPMPQTQASCCARRSQLRPQGRSWSSTRSTGPNARPDHVLNETFDLFLDLGANDEQAEFPVIYTNALTGKAGTDHRHIGDDPRAAVRGDPRAHPAARRATPRRRRRCWSPPSTYDDYKGRIAVGRLQSGTLRKGQPVVRIDHDGKIAPRARSPSFHASRASRASEVDEVQAGDIVAVAGVPDVDIGDTIADADDPRPLPADQGRRADAAMTFGVNTQPLRRARGHRTSPRRKLRERLYKSWSATWRCGWTTPTRADTFTVSGRGELHLAILIETMRREGYEFQVSRPEVIVQGRTARCSSRRAGRDRGRRRSSSARGRDARASAAAR